MSTRKKPFRGCQTGVQSATMPHISHNVQQSQPALFYGVLYGYAYALVWLCASAGSSGCPTDKIDFSAHVGVPTGGACVTKPGGAATCGTLCSAHSLCKLCFAMNCSASGQCTCAFCSQLLDVDFSQAGSQFYLNTKVIGQNTKVVPLPGGLIVGQPLLISFTLHDTRVSLYFQTSAGDIPLLVEFRFTDNTVVFNTLNSGSWGAEDLSTAPFFYQIGMQVSLLCLVHPSHYDVYINRLFIKQYAHIVPPSQATEAKLDADTSTIVLFRR
ncbi:hypothetical protein EGW08_010928 [Elysia chlorotica]|uniref:Galectin n=1 Tax=Elysia chlorotica TaxID=188477 RepID=A0A3S1C2S5_ELYCH|nr:hypothetical protein EGW08_010928 [Elysia chlorotica]